MISLGGLCCCILLLFVCFFFFKQKTAYEMRMSDWSSDVCSSDLRCDAAGARAAAAAVRRGAASRRDAVGQYRRGGPAGLHRHRSRGQPGQPAGGAVPAAGPVGAGLGRSEEHTSELQSLMRISYAVFCLKKKNKKQQKLTIQ